MLLDQNDQTRVREAATCDVVISHNTREYYQREKKLENKPIWYVVNTPLELIPRAKKSKTNS